jgi:hypothetical protein
MNTLQPSADQNQAARSQEYKVRATRELTAIAASKVCKPSNDQRPFRGQRLLAVGAILAVVTPVVMAAMVVDSGINFYSYDFQKCIFDGDWTWLGIAWICLLTRGTSFFFTKRRCQCVGGGSHKS